MKIETLRNIRTMRQVKSSLEVARNQNFKTTSSMSKTAEEIENLNSIGLTNNQTAQILVREKARAAKFEASVERSQQKLLNSRKKMAGLVNRNRALTTLRHEIQHARDHNKSSVSASTSAIKPETPKHGGLRGIEIQY
jgi:hypothetical protein